MTTCVMRYCEFGLCTKVKRHDVVTLIFGGLKCLRCSRDLAPHKTGAGGAHRRR